MSVINGNVFTALFQRYGWKVEQLSDVDYTAENGEIFLPMTIYQPQERLKIAIATFGISEKESIIQHWKDHKGLYLGYYAIRKYCEERTHYSGRFRNLCSDISTVEDIESWLKLTYEYQRLYGMSCKEMISYAKLNPGVCITNTNFNCGEYIYYKRSYNIAQEREIEGFFDEHGLPVEITTAFCRERAIYFDDGWYSKEDVRSAKGCKYQVEIPGVGLCCKYYFDKMGSYRFPPCSCVDCPFVHDVLRDATLHPCRASEANGPIWK